jgi:hypothetical protein
MGRILGVLAATLLALGPSACTGSPATRGKCCSMSSGGSKAEGKPTACETYTGCSRYSNEAPEGTPSREHQP